jgi:hypothetical protein
MFSMIQACNALKRPSALAVEHAGPGQHERSEAHRRNSSCLRQHLRNPVHQVGVLPQRPYVGTAGGDEGIDLVRSNAGDRRGVDHHPDIGWHQSARGGQIRQRIARRRQFDLLQPPRSPLSGSPWLPSASLQGAAPSTAHPLSALPVMVRLLEFCCSCHFRALPARC